MMMLLQCSQTIGKIGSALASMAKAIDKLNKSTHVNVCSQIKTMKSIFLYLGRMDFNSDQYNWFVKMLLQISQIGLR